MAEVRGSNQDFEKELEDALEKITKNKLNDLIQQDQDYADSDEESTYEDVRFDLDRRDYAEKVYERASPDSEDEKIVCDFPLPRGSFWSGSLTRVEKGFSQDFWVMVACNAFTSSIWYIDGHIERIRIEWSENDLVKITNDYNLEIYGVVEETWPLDVMGLVRMRGEKKLGEFFLKKRDLSRNVFVRLGGNWVPARVLEEEDDSIECVVSYSKKAIKDDILSLTLVVREDRIRRGKPVDHCILTTCENVILIILEFVASSGEELQLLSYLSTRIQAVVCDPIANDLWKSLSYARWHHLENSDSECSEVKSWRLFYLSRQQFDYSPTPNLESDYVIDVQNCPNPRISENVQSLNIGKLRFQSRCPFKWDHMKPTRNNTERICRRCKQHVHFVEDIEDAGKLIDEEEIIALPLVPEGLSYQPNHSKPPFPEIPADNGRIKLSNFLPEEIENLNIVGLRETFQNMETRRSRAELIPVFDNRVPTRLDVMGTREFKIIDNLQR